MFGWRPTELVFRDENGNWDYIVGSAPSSLVTRGNVAEYYRAFPDSKDVFRAEAERVKHVFVLDQAPRLPIDTLTTGVEFGITGIISGITLPVGRYDSLSVDGFTLPTPDAKDAMGSYILGSYEVLDTNEGQQLIMWFPADWVLSEERVYPVTIDPTVVTTTTTFSPLGPHSAVVCVNGNGVDIWRNPSTGTLRYAVSADGWASSPGSSTDMGFEANEWAVDIDDGDNIHVLYSRMPSTTVTYFYRRLTPNPGRTAWTVGAETTVHATTYANDYAVDLRVHTEGTGWKAHAFYNAASSTTDYVMYKPLTISSAGAVTVGALTTLRSGSYCVLESVALGGASGKDFVAVWIEGGPLAYRRGTYSAGSWTLGTATVTTLAAYTCSGVYLHTNGDVDLVRPGDAIVPHDLRHARITSVGVITDTEIAWTVQGSRVALAWDQYGNLYAYYQTNAAGNAMVERYLVRSTGAWSGETVIGTSTATAWQHPSAKVGYAGNKIDLMFLEGSASPYNIVHYRRTLNADPLTPSGLSPSGGTAFDGTTSRNFTAVFQDGDVGAFASAYEDEWLVQGGTASTAGKVAITSGHPYAGQAYSVTKSAGTFANGSDWQWRRRYWDQFDRVSPWSAWETFRSSAAPTVSIVSPTSGSTINTDHVTVRWAISDPESRGQGWYRVKLYDATRSATLWDSGEVQSTTVLERAVDYTLAQLTSYQVGVQVRDADGIYSAEVYTTITADYVPPLSPKLLTAVADAAIAATKLKWVRGYSSLATFARSSVAYLPDGTQVASGAPRYGNWVQVTRTATLDFVGKISGSTVENPNAAKFDGATTFKTPSTFSFEFNQTGALASYEGIIQLSDSKTSYSSSSTNNNYTQQLFSFNVLDDLKRKDTVPTTWTVDDLKRYITGMSAAWTGYGVGANASVVTNGAKVRLWTPGTSAWDSGVNNTTSSPSTITRDLTSAGPSGYIDANGAFHILAHSTYPSDGTIASTVYTDYVKLDVTVSYWEQQGNGIMVEESTTNLLTANQSGVETDTTGFGTNVVTVTRSTAAAWHGNASLLVQPTSNGSGRGCYPAPRIAVTAGQAYTFSYYAKQASGGTVQMQPTLEWYNDPTAGSFISGTVGSIVTLTSGWQRISVTGTAPAGATHVTPTMYSGAVTTAESWYVDSLQLEQKAYATSWTLGGTTRAAETLTHPTSADAINSGDFTLEFDYTPTSPPAVTGRYAPLWRSLIDGNNFYGLSIDPAGRVYAEARSGGTYYQTLTASDPVIVQGTTYRLGFHLSGGKLSHFVNGVKGVNSDKPYVAPVGVLPATCSFNGGSGNGVYGPARASQNRPAADLTSTAPLTWDQYTVQFYPWNQTLEGGSQNSQFGDQWEVYLGGTRIAVVDNPASGDVSYTDYAVASGTTYTYDVRAVGNNSTYGPFTSASSVLTITHGAYLHDALDPASTVHHFEYREVQSQDNKTIPSGRFSFLGRESDVVQFDGTATNRTVRLRVAVPDDTDDRAALDALLERRTTICFRDARGRLVYGAMQELPINDERWGGWADVQLIRVPFKEGV